MNKIHFNARLSESTMEIIDKHYQFDDYSSKSEFIEEAIKYYDSYLNAEASTEFLEDVIDDAMKKNMETIANRIGTVLFKQAVEIDMMMHVTAATNEIDEGTLSKLRGECVQEVKSSLGRISFDSAVRIQKG